MKQVIQMTKNYSFVQGAYEEKKSIVKKFIKLYKNSH